MLNSLNSICALLENACSMMNKSCTLEDMENGFKTMMKKMKKTLVNQLDEGLASMDAPGHSAQNIKASMEMFSNAFHDKMDSLMFDVQASVGTHQVHMDEVVEETKKDILANQSTNFRELLEDNYLARKGMKTYVAMAVEFQEKFQELKNELAYKFTSLQTEVREALRRVNID